MVVSQLLCSTSTSFKIYHVKTINNNQKQRYFCCTFKRVVILLKFASNKSTCGLQETFHLVPCSQFESKRRIINDSDSVHIFHRAILVLLRACCVPCWNTRHRGWRTAGGCGEEGVGREWKRRIWEETLERRKVEVNNLK